MKCGVCGARVTSKRTACEVCGGAVLPAPLLSEADIEQYQRDCTVRRVEWKCVLRLQEEAEKLAQKAEKLRQDIEAKKAEVEKLRQDIESKKAEVEKLTEEVESKKVQDMVWISGGTFTMGSPACEVGRYANESPPHQVTVSGFYMGKYEVTQREYEKVMGTNPSHFKGTKLPVEQVSWYDAVEYCNQRSRREGFIPAYTISGFGDKRAVIWNRNANGYRLPTEAEWEYACRAGTTSLYYTGNSLDNTGWYSGNSASRTHPVGEKQPNAWGLYDMHGNVWEWCWDWYGAYANGSKTDPMGASSGSNHVNRGGSWGDFGRHLRSANRYGSTPSYKHYYLGFRVVRP